MGWHGEVRLCSRPQAALPISCRAAVGTWLPGAKFRSWGRWGWLLTDCDANGLEGVLESAFQLLYVLSLCSRWTAGPSACCFTLWFMERCPLMVLITKTSSGRSAVESTGSPRSPQVCARGGGRGREATVGLPALAHSFCFCFNVRKESPVFSLSPL